jgi:hypothetical protein
MTTITRYLPLAAMALAVVALLLAALLLTIGFIAVMM